MIVAHHPRVDGEFHLFAGYLLWRDMLIMSDLHIGKTMHFRKAGLPIPSNARNTDLSQLITIFETHKPSHVVVLGDLFHSDLNSEVEDLAMVIAGFKDIKFELVIGNHDVLEPAVYRSLDFEVTDQVTIENLTMTHEPIKLQNKNQVNLHGHIHPGVHLRGKGRQSLVMPCFHFAESHICLPAFGELTGCVKIRPKKNDRIFAIANDQVIDVTHL